MTDKQTLDANFQIVDPATGRPTFAFLEYLRLNGGYLTEAEQALATLAETIGNRQVIAGAGLTGGGALSADVTLDVGAGTGITINANDVALEDTVVTPGSYTAANITVDQQGRLTAASDGGLAPFSGAMVSLTSSLTAQNFTGSPVNINWTTALHDTDSYWASSPNPHLLTVPADGYYLWTAQFRIENITANQFVRAFLGGTPVGRASSTNTVGTIAEFPLVLGPVFQAAGSSRSVSILVQSDTSVDLSNSGSASHFSVTRVG